MSDPNTNEELVPLTVRFTETIINEVKKSAKRNRRSVNSEYVARMERSLAEDSTLAKKMEQVIRQSKIMQNKIDQLSRHIKDLQD